jgi:hypothetical protein
VILLDSLAAQKHYAFENQWIGDKNFVNELDHHIENAKQHLLALDSLNTVKQIKLFQEKIDREHLRTNFNLKRGIPRDPRFVVREAFLLLYYNAQYVLDRLPGRR